MEDLKDQVEQLAEHWGKAFAAASGAPDLWKPHLPPPANISMINEAVETVRKEVGRLRAPSGFHPVFHLARVHAGVALPSLIALAKQLEAGQYGQIANFATALVGILSSLHTMAVYSEKMPPDTLHADLQAQVSETLALLGTAQRELSTKLAQLEKSQSIAKEIEESHSKIEAIETDAAAALEQIQEDKAATKDLTATTRTVAEQAAEEKTHIEELLQAAEAANKETEEAKGLLMEAQQRAKKQLETIDSILPKGASAGLAAAFSARSGSLEKTKMTWMLAFIATVVVLGGFAVYLTSLVPPTGIGYWQFVLYKAALAGPLIWLGWFSAVQYGNTIRIQEDYAFKEATSKAFQGYRDHLQYLASLSNEDGENAMALLAKKTIEILALEPGRIYGRTHHDASPLQTIATLFRRKPEEKEKGETEQH
ncbi:MAG TPA: hypothetical protein VGM84_18120 [Steroidobacteraceae bacterium]